MVLRLNRTPTEITRIARNDINENWGNIERDFNNVVNVVSDSAYEQIVNSARLIWQEPVDTFADLSSTYPNAVEGWAAWAKESVGGISKAYRFNGEAWVVQQEFNGTAIEEVDTRLTQQIITKAEKDYVAYEDFGAVGDGITDDFLSIYNAHVFANENNIPVKTIKNGAIYLIKNAANEIPIRTDTDWSLATIIIDDSTVSLSDAQRDIFVVVDENPTMEITSSLSSLTKDTKTIPALSNEGNVILRLENSNTRRWIRKGANADSGLVQQESIHVNNGRVLSDILWDYPAVTRAVYKKISTTQRVIKGGIVRTLRNTLPSDFDTGVRRGIRIERSNTKISINHEFIEHNGPQAKPYFGFIYSEFVYDLIVSDSSFTAHRVYNFNNVPSGTYELSFKHTLKITMDRVMQSNSITSDTLWGIHTSNFCKDMVITNSSLSRVDCHTSLHNIRVSDSDIGRQGLQLNGSGLCEIKRCNFYSVAFVFLRDDYGSTWDGLVKILDSSLIPSSTDNEPHFVDAINVSDHNFGYKCYHPDLELENIKVTTKSTDVVSLFYTKYVDTQRISNLTELDYDLEVAQGRYPYIFKNFVRAKNVNVSTECLYSIFYNPQSAMYCENSNKFSVTTGASDLNNPDPISILGTNFYVEIDNCNLTKTASMEVNSGGFIAFRATSTTRGDFNFNNHRMLPRIILKNMDFAINAGIFPFVLTAERCNIYRLNAGPVTNKYGHLEFKECTFMNTQPYSYEAKNMWFDNVTFVASNVNNTSSVTFTQLKNMYTFLGRIQTINNNRLKLSVRMFNTSFTNPITSNEFDDSLYAVNLNEMLKKNVNFDTYLRKFGTTSERPPNDLFNGAAYYNTETNKQDVYINGSWI